jgi:nicotinate-nucleotide adenylyltransferase
MEFFQRAAAAPRKLAIFAGAFHPPTCAHLAIAGAALDRVDEVVFVLPRIFPHKEWSGADFSQRIALLQAALADQPRCSIASSSHGLFIEIAGECREAYGDGVQLYVLCGRDAAERIVNWDYGHPDAFHQQLDVFELLVASREGEYQPPADIRDRVHKLPLALDYDAVSSSEVRRRIREGEPWEHLVPADTVELLKSLR